MCDIINKRKILKQYMENEIMSQETIKKAADIIAANTVKNKTFNGEICTLTLIDSVFWHNRHSIFLSYFILHGEFDYKFIILCCIGCSCATLLFSHIAQV